MPVEAVAGAVVAEEVVAEAVVVVACYAPAVVVAQLVSRCCFEAAEQKLQASTWLLVACR
jgi:hypothetical protein